MANCQNASLNPQTVILSECKSHRLFSQAKNPSEMHRSELFKDPCW